MKDTHTARVDLRMDCTIEVDMALDAAGHGDTEADSRRIEDEDQVRGPASWASKSRNHSASSRHAKGWREAYGVLA